MNLLEPDGHFARLDMGTKARTTIVVEEDQRDSEDVLTRSRWRRFVDCQGEAKDVDDLKSDLSTARCGGSEVAPEEVVYVPGCWDEEHLLEDVLKSAANPVPGVDGSDGTEGHGQEGGLKKFA